MLVAMTTREQLNDAASYMGSRGVVLVVPGQPISADAALVFTGEPAALFDSGGFLRERLPSTSWTEDGRPVAQWALARAGLRSKFPRGLDGGPVILDPVNVYEECDMTRLARAFKALREGGCIADGALGVTSSDGWDRVHAAQAEADRFAVFWNVGSHDAFDEFGNLKDELVLQWAGEADAIVAAIAGEDFEVRGPHDPSMPIRVRSWGVARRQQISSEAGYELAFSDEIAGDAPMSPRGATYAAAYFMALADGKATQDELDAITKHLDALAPRTVSAGRDADEQIQITMDAAWARSEPDELIGRIARALPKKQQRVVALLVAALIASADNEIHDDEVKLLRKLGAAFNLDDADIAAVVVKARSVAR